MPASAFCSPSIKATCVSEHREGWHKNAGKFTHNGTEASKFSIEGFLRQQQNIF
jgi:hypothetical protein